MSEALFTAIIAAIPPTLMALAAFLQSVKNSRKADETNVKTTALEKKTDEIHTLANSNLAKVSTQLEVATAKIAGLEKLVTALSEAKNAASTAAIATAAAVASSVPGPPGPPGEPGPAGETGPKGDKGGK